MKLNRTRRLSSVMTLLTMGCTSAGTPATQATFEQLRQTMVESNCYLATLQIAAFWMRFARYPGTCLCQRNFAGWPMKIIRYRSDLNRRFHSHTLLP